MKRRQHRHRYVWAGGYDEPMVAHCICGAELSLEQVLAILNGKVSA